MLYNWTNHSPSCHTGNFNGEWQLLKRLFGTKTLNLRIFPDTFLTQANQAGSSSAMEALGHQKAMSFLLTTSMIITTFVSDRHATIAKWMRETFPRMCKELGKPVIMHFYDLWHIGKSTK